MTLNDWEFSYRDYMFGGDLEVAIVDIQGLLSLPDVTVTNHSLLRRNGLVPGDPFVRGRTVRFTVDLQAKDTIEFTSLISNMRDMTSPLVDESEMLFKVPWAFGGGESRLIGRVVRRNLPIDLNFLYRNTEIVFDFFCSYPFIESGSSITTAMSLSSETGGRTYDRSYDLTYGTSSTDGSYLLMNVGNEAANYVATFTGPLTKPRLTLQDTGEFLEFDITLAAGQQLVVDTKSRTALLGGSASRINTLTLGSTWWLIPPGFNGSTVNFTAASFSEGTASLEHRATYL